MRIFLTGGTGFIGRAVLSGLLRDGHEVVALVRDPGRLPPERPPGLSVAKGDLSGVGFLVEALKGCRRVFHLAAMARAWHPDPDEFNRTNVEGTRHLFEAALRARVEKTVYTSSVMAIGPTDGFVADESTPNATAPLSNYQRTKALAEEVAVTYVRKGLPLVVVLPSLVYGPSGDSRRVSFNRFLQDFLIGKPVVIPGDGTQRLNAVYLDDVVAGIRLAIEKGRPGERYILGGENLSVRELADRVNDIAGTKWGVRHVPFWMAKAAGLIEEGRARLLNRNPLITWTSVETYRHSWTYSSEKAKRELGYAPRSIREGLALTLEWLRRNRARRRSDEEVR
jgi:nucleoside-diphosphate-sugar epimerase